MKRLACLPVGIGPAAWSAVAAILLTIAMPRLGPVFAALFPGLDRPLYDADPFWRLMLDHLALVALSTGLAGVIGITAGVAVTRPWGEPFRRPLRDLATLGQAFPPVAVLAVAVPAVGFGPAPALIALTAYGLLPIIENTMRGLDAVPADLREAAAGTGLTGLAILWQVELPLAAPFILAGVRTSLDINVGTAAIASTVGVKSLGLPIIVGLNTGNAAYVLEGAVLVAALAVSLDQVAGWAGRWLVRWKRGS